MANPNTNAAATEPRSEIPEQRPVEYSLSKIVEWLESDRTASEPVVQCPICYGEISVKGISPHNPVDASPSATTTTTITPDTTTTTQGDEPVAIALCCSHILCSACAMRIYVSIGPNPDRKRKCVLCRRRTVGTRCGHMIMTPVPSRSHAYGLEGGLERYPHGGQETPEWCPRCVIEGRHHRAPRRRLLMHNPPRRQERDD